MNEIKQEIDEVKWHIEQAKKEDEYTFCLSNKTGKRYILSKYNPRWSIQINKNTNKYNKETVWIVFGFGFGYILENIFKNYGENTEVLVIEPNVHLLERQIEKINVKFFEDKSGLSFFSGNDFKKFKDIVANKLHIENVNNIEILEHPEYVKFYIKYFKKVVEIIGEIRAQRIVNDNTIRKINSAHVKNILKNSVYIKESFRIENHKNKYKDIPAVIVSAGPSLDKNIKYLKDFKGLVFAVGRTLPVLKRYDVKADFTAILDWSDIIQGTFGEEEKSGVPIIASTVANNSIIKNATGPIYFVDKDQMTEKIFGVCLESLDTGGSVATLCLSAAHYMGCNPLIFIGQDLAYTEMRNYAEDCNIYEIDIEKGYKNNKKNYREIEGYYGDRVTSDYALISFLRWIEGFINRNQDRTYINATEGGAKIEGTVQECFHNIVEKYKDTIRPQVCHIESNEKVIDIKERLTLCKDELEVSLKLIKNALKLCSKLKDEYEVYFGIRENKIVTIVEKLDQIDEELLKIDNNTLFEYIFHAKYSEIMRDKRYQEPIHETELEKGKRIALKSHQLYKSLYEAVDTVKNLIKNEINEVKK